MVFDPEKRTFSISSGTKLGTSGMFLSPCLIPRHRCEISVKRISFATLTFDHANVTTSTREPTTYRWIRADIRRHDGTICSKSRKIVPYHK